MTRKLFIGETGPDQDLAFLGSKEDVELTKRALTASALGSLATQKQISSGDALDSVAILEDMWLEEPGLVASGTRTYDVLDIVEHFHNNIRTLRRRTVQSATAGTLTVDAYRQQMQLLDADVTIVPLNYEGSVCKVKDHKLIPNIVPLAADPARDFEPYIDLSPEQKDAAVCSGATHKFLQAHYTNPPTELPYLESDQLFMRVGTLQEDGTFQATQSRVPVFAQPSV